MSGATTAGGWNSNPVYTVGSVTDIPISAIVSFVHNACNDVQMYRGKIIFCYKVIIQWVFNILEKTIK